LRYLILVYFLFRLTFLHSQETLEIGNKDFVVLFSKNSELTKLTVDLNGKWKITSESNNNLKNGLELLTCFLYYTEDYSDFTNEDWIKIFNYQFPYVFNSVQSDKSPEIRLMHQQHCFIDRGDKLTLAFRQAPILISQFSALNLIKDYQELYEPVFIIEESGVLDSIDKIIAKEKLDNEKAAKIEQRYRELALDNDKSYIGSINIRYPNHYDINLCTFDVDGDPAIPVILYPSFDPENTFTSGLLNASKESLKNLNKNEPYYYNDTYKNLDEFFELWQLNNQNCDTFVAYASDLIKFVDSASKINKNFGYEFNHLIETNKLYAHWAKLYGDYESWDNYKFAEQINGNKEILSILKQFDIHNFEEYLSINEQMVNEGYEASLNDGNFYQYNIILEYLDDLNVANLEDTTASEIKKQRLENEKIAKEIEEKLSEAEVKEDIYSAGEDTYSGSACTMISEYELELLINTVNSFGYNFDFYDVQSCMYMPPRGYINFNSTDITIYFDLNVAFFIQSVYGGKGVCLSPVLGAYETISQDDCFY